MIHYRSSREAGERQTHRKGGIINTRRKKSRTNQVEESPGELVATRGPARRKTVALDDVDVLALALVEAVVLATDGAHLERIAEQLASFLRKEPKIKYVALRQHCQNKRA